MRKKMQTIVPYSWNGTSQTKSTSNRATKNPANQIVLREFGAGLTRLELATSCVTGRRSNQTELQPLNVKINLSCSRGIIKLTYLSAAPSLRKTLIGADL